MKKNNSQTGFTLVEIMIVVGIIMIIAVIALPAMLRNKMVGNEANAIAAVRTISTACNFYTFQKSAFPANLNALVTESPPYIDAALANTSLTNPKDGYYYTYALNTDTAFIVIARPNRWGMTGSRCFSADQSGKILYCNTGADCTPDLPL